MSDSFRFFSKVLKAQQYTLEDIFQKHLLLLFPFRLMRFNANNIKKIAMYNTLSELHVTQCEEELTRLKSETFDKGEEMLFRNLVSYTVQVIDHLFVKYEKLRMKLRKAMGVRYIETALQAQERAEKERDIVKAERDAVEARARAAEKQIEQLKSLVAKLGELTATLTKFTDQIISFLDVISILDAAAEKLELKTSDAIHSNAPSLGNGPLPTAPAI